jgi:DNA-binding HxlR family transcriptional regulator
MTGRTISGEASLKEPALDAAAMLEAVVGCKWAVRILGLIASGCDRPSAMLRACSGLSAKVMNERLAKLQRFGIAARSVSGERPPFQVVYRLTPFGERFAGLLEEVQRLQEELDEQRASFGDMPPRATRRSARGSSDAPPGAS